MALVNLLVQIPAELKVAAAAAAEKNKQSLADFVGHALASAVGRPEMAEKRRPVGRPKKPASAAN